MNTIAHIPGLPAGSSPAEHPDVVTPVHSTAPAEPWAVETDLARTIRMIEKEVTAPGLLKRAAEVMEARAKEYDKPEGERSIGAVVVALNAILGREALSEAEGWLFMTLLKNVRLFSAKNYHADSGLDGVAYQALTAEAKAKES